MEELRIFIAPRRKLSKLMGVSPSTIYYRIQKLQKDKKLVSFYSNGRASLYIKK